MNFIAGENTPVNELDDNVVEMYIEDMRANCEEIFIPFKNLCTRKSVSFLFLSRLDVSKGRIVVICATV